MTMNEFCSTYIAIDLGASGGRVMRFQVNQDKQISLHERYRFANRPTLLGNSLHWDVARLLEEICQGISLCCEEQPLPRSLAIDTWGTDFGLITSSGMLVCLPFSYRQFSGEETMQRVHHRIHPERLYALTGIQRMPVNTLYQLYEIAQQHPALVQASDRLLFMPDLLNYFLSGKAVSEVTIASTSQLLNPQTQRWETEIMDTLELTSRILPEIVQPGTELGKLIPEQARRAFIPELTIRTCASHDTASAVAAAPVSVDNEPWVFISSGTWSLIGVELPSPILTNQAYMANFTNEAGVLGTTLLLKNVTGLWLLQRILQDLSKENGTTDLDSLLAAAGKSPPFYCFINPNDRRFHNPTDMVRAIEEFCLETSQPAPQTPAQCARCIFESLAFSYASVIETLKQLTNLNFKRIHILGGGSKNDLLNQWTADACGLEVIAGPAEATAIGNGLIQAIQDGWFNSLAEARRSVRNAFPIKIYHPQDIGSWQDHFSKFLTQTQFHINAGDQ